jgi:hypothetical protein
MEPQDTAQAPVHLLPPAQYTTITNNYNKKKYFRVKISTMRVLIETGMGKNRFKH